MGGGDLVSGLIMDWMKCLKEWIVRVNGYVSIHGTPNSG